MSFLKKLFGARPEGTARQAVVRETETYKDFVITPAPMAEGGQFRLAATIEGTLDGAARTHRLIRADLFPTEEEAASAAIRKARQMIDEQGAKLLVS